MGRSRTEKFASGGNWLICGGLNKRTIEEKVSFPEEKGRMWGGDRVRSSPVRTELSGGRMPGTEHLDPQMEE